MLKLFFLTTLILATITSNGQSNEKAIMDTIKISSTENIANKKIINTNKKSFILIDLVSPGATGNQWSNKTKRTNKVSFIKHWVELPDSSIFGSAGKDYYLYTTTGKPGKVKFMFKLQRPWEKKPNPIESFTYFLTLKKEVPID